MTPLHRDPEAIRLAHLVLTELRELSLANRYAALVTDDGFDIAHLPLSGQDTGRLASMSSSVQALGEAVARELVIGDAQYVAIAAETGHVVQLRVPGRPIVLAAHFDDRETLGRALSLSRRAAERLAELLATAPLGAEITA